MPPIAISGPIKGIAPSSQYAAPLPSAVSMALRPSRFASALGESEESLDFFRVGNNEANILRLWTNRKQIAVCSPNNFLRIYIAVC